MSKALTKEEISLNAHVEELRERMRMLQSDRTANIDILEANKTANKEEIKRLRAENKEFDRSLHSYKGCVNFIHSLFLIIGTTSGKVYVSESY